uniref:Regulator of G-protein signaling 22 isoform X2 n=1 Tax=Geotrypetes seraphini TaxID=260995 RepID=A0A6P8PQF7_GEOSA|nr:regulator of G-protein signaling 22 isoform X2 [Geotrypetes seraphini]
MREKRLTTEPPVITEHNFTDLLATDDLLADYFNEFLCLPVFTQPIKFNRIYGNFELIDENSLNRKEKLKNIIKEHKARHQRISFSKDAPTDSLYTVKCLNRKQGLQWIRKERLPIFLASDCYFEYRLAKLLSQVKLRTSGVALRIDSKYCPWPYEKEVLLSSQPSPIPQDDHEAIAKKFYASFGQATFTQTKDWFTLAKQSLLTTFTPSIQRPLAWGPVQSQDLMGSRSQDTDLQEATYKPLVSKYSSTSSQPSRPSEVYSDEKITDHLKQADEYSVSFAESPSPTPIRVYIDQPWETGSKVEYTNHTIDEDKESGIETIVLEESLHSPNIQHIEEFAAGYVEHLLKSTIEKLMNQPTEEIFDKSDDFNELKVVHDLPHSPTSVPLNSQSSSTSSLSSELDLSFIIPEFRDEEISLSSESDDEETNDKVPSRSSLKKINTRKNFEKFKSFLKGTIGEKNWWLWMDIERLRSIKDPKRQQRHLIKMRKLYLVTGEDHYMHAETLLKLGLRDGNQWNANYLYNIQAQIVKPLLLYWGPRYCLSQTSSPYINEALKMWQDRQLRRKKNINPFLKSITLLPMRTKSNVQRISSAPSRKTGSSSPRSFPQKDKQPRRILSATTGSVKQKKTLKNKPSSAPPKLESTEKRYTSEKHRLSQSSDIIDEFQRPQTRQGRRSSKQKQLKDISGPLEKPTMDTMLQGLQLESRAGYYFTQFCEHSKNKLWENNINFWFDLQNFHHLFNQDTLQPFKLISQAQFLFASYLAPSATMDTGVVKSVKSEIYHRLDPPFDDLFDSAEDSALTLLLNAWTELTKLDSRAFGQIDLEEETRQVDMKVLLGLLKQYLRKKKESAYKTSFPFPADATLQPYSDLSLQPPLIRDFAYSEPPQPRYTPRHEPTPISKPAVSDDKNYWEDVPEELRNIDLGILSSSRTEMEFLFQSLVDSYEKTDLKCWEAIENFRRMSHTDIEGREEMSKQIKTKYLNKNYFFGPNSPASKEEQDQIMQMSGGWGRMLADTLPSSVLPEIQKIVRRRIEKKSLPKFLATEEFQKRYRSKKLGRLSSDLLSEFWKDSLASPYESETAEESEESESILTPITFKRPAFEGFFDTLVQDLPKEVPDEQELQAKRRRQHLWKDLCHSHCDESVIQNKITAIIDCFINSTVPPTLQIDIPIEQAEKIIEHRKDLGPYIFREAQMTVFNNLFKLWPEFCTFKSNLTDEKFLPLMEKRRTKQLKQLQKRIKEAEKSFRTDEADFLRRRYEDMEADQMKWGGRKTDRSSKQFDKKKALQGIVEDRMYGKRPHARDRSMYGYNASGTWSYSKYLEAIEQERMLLKIQDDLEQKSSSTFYTDISSAYSTRTESMKLAGKPYNSSIQGPK